MSRELMRTLFERDLSTAEMDQIQARLKAGPEEAAYFADLAALHYGSLGLRPPKARRAGGWKLWGGIGAGALVAALWAWWPSASQTPPSPSPAPARAQSKLAPPAAAPTFAPAAKPQAQPTRFDEGEQMRVEVALPRAMRVQVELFDAQGHRLRRLFDGESPPGGNSYLFDGKDKNGNTLAPGRYRVVVDYGGGVMERWFELK